MLRALSKLNVRHGMHLSITADGQVSLWDTRAAAMSAPDSEYLWLSLTNTQLALIMCAARRRQGAEK